jgi:succinyl-diaminopimelate desuccinylase
VVPDRCSIDVDIRTVPGLDLDDLVESVRVAVDGLGFPVDVTVTASMLPVETDPGLPIVQTALDLAARIAGQAKPASAMPYVTDASIYQPALHIPVILFGPGEARLAHQPDEWVAVSKYLDAIRFYVAFAQTYLA